MTNAFGRRSNGQDAARVAPNVSDRRYPSTIAPMRIAAITFAVAIVVIATGLAGFKTLGSKSFPSEGTAAEQCLYALKNMASNLTTLCDKQKQAEDTVYGYRLWEKYSALDPTFPYLGDPKFRCTVAVMKLNMETMKAAGLIFADDSKCMFDQDRDELVKIYFDWLARNRKVAGH